MADKATKHTPGPWKICKANGGKCRCHLIWSIPADCVVAIAASKDEEEFTCGEGISHEQAVTNSHLIGAAPEMLVELTKVRDWLNRNAALLEDAAKRHSQFKSIADDELANAKNYRATAKQIDAVIAKAEGR